MEFAWRGRPITAAADDGRPLRFLDPPPPTHGDANAFPGDAALARRREELLRELHEERIRQDMILRELAETERAMGFAAAGHHPVPTLLGSQDYWHCRPSLVPPWEEPPLRPPRASTEHPLCCCWSGSPVTARPPPVYPHVERSPSPSPLPRSCPSDDVVQEQECKSSGSRAHPMNGYVELCQSPSKRALAEEAMVPPAGNASVKRVCAAPFRQKVALGHQWTDGVSDRRADLEDGHGMQPLHESGNQSSGQRRAAECAMDDQINEPVQRPCRYSLASKENATFDQQKQLEFSEPTPEQPQPGRDAEQQQECRSSGAREDLWSGSVEQCRSPGKRTPLEETLVPAAANTGIRHTWSALFGEEVAPEHRRAVGGEPKVDLEDGHSVQPLYEIRNQSSGQRTAVESAMEGRINKPKQPPRWYRPAGQENAAYNEQKRIENSESTPERTSSGLKRKLTTATPPVKKQKPLGEWSCALCQVNRFSQRHLDEHLAGPLHQSIVAARQSSRNDTAEPNTKATTVWNRIVAKNTEPLRQDGMENVAEHWGPPPAEQNRGPASSRWTCHMCQAKCTSESDFREHLRGRRHRENRDNRKSSYYCEVCDVQCNSEMNLESHLGGRRHRETLEGRD